ncbi:rhomboid family intramembrane serine protease [Eubacterium oxidoreducens]|uniref:Rhomboid protease GluP n=1 Tax=Eubacterium oxidoreducens TaxID=1732 RepID=A0A1G6A040_EUBOX|nr:rhomboid family intramembrane serine protease [Eubacterium oxidoreducens]SDB01772.1 rhomboid protease GluP [Eubacterium oxidoreducens]
MIKQFDQALKQNGYRFLSVRPEEAGVYYRQIGNLVQVVTGIQCHEGFDLTTQLVQRMQASIEKLFSGKESAQFGILPMKEPIRVQQMVVLLSESPARERAVCASVRGVWMIDTAAKQLMIYENQPADFYGLNAILEQLLIGEKEEKTASVNRSNMRQRINRRIGYCNLALIVSNIIIFAMLSVIGDTTDANFMVEHGAMYAPFITAGKEWYRIFTSMFLHFGFEHLLNNMIILACIGNYLERTMGHVRYLILYFIAGMIGNMGSLYVSIYDQDLAVSAGASGAIFGVIGGLLWVVICHKGRLENLSTKGLLIMIILSLYFGFTSSGVDNVAHVAGLIGGFVCAMILYRKRYRHCL